MLELLFIGAGPHSLATLTRLLEPNPDPGVDAPQRHVHSKNKVLSYWQRQRTCPTYRAALTQWLDANVAVVDPSGSWMSRWHQQFTALGISHLRSTTAVHPDPFDSYALATYAAVTHRTAELMPLEHIDKTRDFAGPFAVPGARLFEDFCRDLVQRYCLEGSVLQDKVSQLTPVFSPTPNGTASGSSSSSSSPSGVSHWQVLLASGRQLTAKHVVLGIGSTNMQRVPEALAHLQPVPLLNPGLSTGSSDSPSSSSPSTAVMDQPAEEGPGQVAAAAAGSSANVGSECCSGCCDGACSNSSGWSADSTQQAAAAATPPAAAAAPQEAAAAASKPLDVDTLAAVPAAASESSTSADTSTKTSSPRSASCDSLCSWMDLQMDLDEQQQQQGPVCLPPAAAAAGGATTAAGPPPLTVPGPCAWVSACSSPTSGCDSLCSWLGCEHTAAALLAAAQQHLDTMAAVKPPAYSSECEAVSLAESLSVAAGCCSSSNEPNSSASIHTNQPSNTAAAAPAPAAAPAAPAAAAAVQSSDTDSTANTYPWGRMMHAWQLVEALQPGGAAGATADSVAGITLDKGGSSSSSRASISGSGRKKGARVKKGRQSSSSSDDNNLQGSTRAAGKLAASSIGKSAALLQQRGLLLPGESVIIVGGGLTTAHLAALAAAATSASAPPSPAAAGSCSSSRGSSVLPAAAHSIQSTNSSASRHGQKPDTRAAAAAAGGAAAGGAAGAAAAPAGGATRGGAAAGAKVSLLLRGSLRVKQFDVDTEWMGRNRGSTLQFGFKQLADMADRLALMRRVLQGGSITPEAAVTLSELRRAGLLEVCEQSELLDAAWDWQEQRWDVWLQDGRLMHADRLWIATGSALAAQAEPLLAPLLQQLPVPVVAGLPAIRPDLEWAAGSRLFVLGAYAALQLGPGALNLAGAKTGSVVAAQQLQGRLPELPAAVVAAAGGRRGVVVGSGRGQGV